MAFATVQTTRLADHLIKDFAGDTECTRVAVAALYGSLSRNLKKDSDNKLTKLIDCWHTLFGKADFHERLPAVGKSALSRLATKLGIEADPVNPCNLFFALHTYIALIIKLIAYYSVGHIFPNFHSLLVSMRRCSDGQLERTIRKLQDDTLLAECGISNFHDGDIFQWYLDVWDKSISCAMRTILERLQSYSSAVFYGDDNDGEDCFKCLYQRLVPAPIRHQLGEYYTPDWLVELVLSEIGYQGQPDKRLLDPTCGSGSFLVLAVGRLKERCFAEGMTRQETLLQAVNDIVGLDINPLAVLAARTSYLRVLGSLLAETSQQIRIPVYLADSILTPYLAQSHSANDLHEVHTWIGHFLVPGWLKSHEEVRLLCQLLERSVAHQERPDEFLERATATLSLAGPATHEQKTGHHVPDSLAGLYHKLIELRVDGLDRIGVTVLRDALSAMGVGQFDFIAGNPPWIGWESLSPEFRKHTKWLWQRYGLFAHSGMETILGKGRKDVSMLISYAVTDRLLKSEGKLGFVITQSAFKTAGAADGFRRFRLGDTPEDAMKVTVVHDLSDLQFFDGASTRTCLFVWEKGQGTNYPVPYRVWQKVPNGPSLHQGMRLTEVMATTRRLDFVAEPINPLVPTSTWLTIDPAMLPTLRRLVGRSNYKAYEGVNSGGANGIFWVEILRQRTDGLMLVQNITEGTRRAVPRVCVEIEPDLVYPLLRGCEVKRWSAQPSAHVILVQDVATRKGIDIHLLRERFPRTYSYLKRFEPHLRARAAFRRYFLRAERGGVIETAPFYSMFNAGTYSLSPWKVVWHRMVAPLGAAVVGQQAGKPILPQETHAFVPTHSRREAYYLAGMLNSRLFRWAAMAYSPVGSKSFGSPHLLENLYIPLYDSHNSRHVAVAAIAETIQERYGGRSGADLDKCELQLDEAAGRVWELNAQNISSVHDALSRMTKADLKKR